MTNNVHWASATPREKAFIEEVARVTYERDRVRGSDCLCQKSALPLRHKRFDPHFDPHREMSGRNTWSKEFPTSFFLGQKRPQSLIYQRLEGILSLGKDEAGGSNPPSSSKKHRKLRFSVLFCCISKNTLYGLFSHGAEFLVISAVEYSAGGGDKNG